MQNKIILPDERFNSPEFAKNYANRHSRMALNFAEKISDKLIRKNIIRSRILDTGCGSGFTIIELSKKFPEIEFFGIDLSDPLLHIANEKIKKEDLGGRVKFIKADVLNIPFPDHYFDFVININMVHLVEDPIKMLNEIERVLKTDGLFYITDLKKSILGFWEKEIKTSFTIKEAKEVIAKSNLLTGGFSSEMIWWRYQNI